MFSSTATQKTFEKSEVRVKLAAELLHHILKGGLVMGERRQNPMKTLDLYDFWDSCFHSGSTNFE